jgi:UDP-glucose 4-epimerase
MNILVTGCAGFMGSWLVDELLSKGHDVIGIDDLSGGSLRNLEEANKKRRFKFIQGDLRDHRLCNTLCKDVEVIFHLAAYAAEGQSFFSPIQINDINIKPMNNLLVAAINNNVKRFIFTSSMAVYGNQIPPFKETNPRDPVDPYGAGKAYCENMLEIFHEIYGLEYVIIRPHNVFGERQNTADPYRNVIGIWMNMMLRNVRPIIYGDGLQTRAFSYIRNVTPALANSLDCESGSIINLGGEDEKNINDIFLLTKVAMQYEGEPLYMTDRPGEVKHAYCTNDKARELLKYRDTYSMEAGLMKMAEWVKKLGPQKPTYRLPLEITKNAPMSWRERLI